MYGRSVNVHRLTDLCQYCVYRVGTCSCLSCSSEGSKNTLKIRLVDDGVIAQSVLAVHNSLWNRTRIVPREMESIRFFIFFSSMSAAELFLCLWN